jgi:hypothetical protein
MSVHYNNVRSFFSFSFSSLVSTANTTTPTVQPLVRSNNNNIRQPAIVQRQHHSSPTSSSPSSAITATTYREARPTTAEMMTTIESTRYENLSEIDQR